jgi:hypothetical protein
MARTSLELTLSLTAAMSASRTGKEIALRLSGAFSVMIATPSIARTCTSCVIGFVDQS